MLAGLMAEIPAPPTSPSQEHQLPVPRGVGVLSQRFYELLEQCTTEQKCLSCHIKCPSHELLTCLLCGEHGYCSTECGLADTDTPRQTCVYVGLQKGILECYTAEESHYIKNILHRAQLLDSNGNLKPKPKSSSPSSHQTYRNFPTVELESGFTTGGGKDRKLEDGRGKDGTQNHLTIHGCFGGCVQCSSQVLDGTCFGHGWWKAPLFNITPPRCAVGACETNIQVAHHDPVARLTYIDIYGDVESDGENDANEQTDTCAAGSCSNSESDVESRKSLEDETDVIRPVENVSSTIACSPVNFGTCNTCFIFGPDMKICGRCREVFYCSKECQLSHFPEHKKRCRQVARLKSCKVPSLVLDMIEHRYGCCLETVYSVDNLPTSSECFFGVPFQVNFMAEIVRMKLDGAFYTLIVKDVDENTVFAMFPRDRAFSRFHIPDFGDPVSLSVCMSPGKRVLFIDAWWNDILNTIGSPMVNTLDDLFFFM